MELGKKLRNLRKEQRLTQAELAKKAGVSQSSISDIETSNRVLKVEQLEQICMALNVPISEFIGDIDTTAKTMMPPPDYQLLSPENRRLVDDLIKALSAAKSNAFIKEEFHRISVLGEAAAGAPIYAPADDDDIIELPAKYADPALQCYAIRARGDSMEPKIHSGDIIIAQHDVAADPGQIAVVRLASLSDDEYAIKVVSVDNGKCILRSYNPKYPPMIYSADDIRACEKVLEIIPQV